MKIFEGNYIPQGVKIGIIVARFNSFVTVKILDGAVDTLKRHGVDDDSIEVAYVPGAFEIPIIAKKMAESGKYDAVICLGAVIRGSTSHYELVCNECAKGIAQVSLNTGVPVMFGVVTAENLEQAIDRAGAKSGNKGSECAEGAIEMINLIKGLGE